MRIESEEYGGQEVPQFVDYYLKLENQENPQCNSVWV
jgi:hypothetical protein